LAASPFRSEYPLETSVRTNRRYDGRRGVDIRIGEEKENEREREREMKKEREKEKEDLSRSGLLAIREGPPHGILSRNRRISA